MAQSPEYPDLLWRPPNSFSKGRPEGSPRLIVVHYTAGHEGYDDAENGAAYDMARRDGTSSHYYIDADSVVQCVRTTDRAHTAMYHGNMYGIHYELCGTAQSRAQWLDPISRATIRHAARQIARDMAKYKIPLLRIRGAQVRTGKGICGHVDCTTGWPEDHGTHTDPGEQFPWDVLLTDISEFSEGGEDMPSVDEVWNTKLPVPNQGSYSPLSVLMEIYLRLPGRGVISQMAAELKGTQTLLADVLAGQGKSPAEITAMIRDAVEQELREAQTREADALRDAAKPQ